MLLPAQYFWLESVLFAAIIVFIVDLVGKMITEVFAVFRRPSQ